MNYSVNLRSLGAKAPRPTPRPGEGVATKQPQRIDFAEALELGSFHAVHGKLMETSEAGVVDWERFDIAEVAGYMPSMATFDCVETPEGEADFRYGFAGENLNRVAKRSLRGLSLRAVLTGPSRDAILDEYTQTLAEQAPSASTGMVDISDMFWIRYLRFLYPVRRNGEVDRLLCFMLFASRSGGRETAFAKSAV